MSKIKDKFEKHYTKSGFYAMNNVKGITLTTLVITIVVLLILASVATYTGIEAIENTKRTKFIAELKIMQSHVNQWYEDCKPSVNATEYDKKFATNVQTKFTINGNVAVNATSSEPLVSDKVAQAQSSLNNANVEPKYHGNFYILEESQLQALGVEGVSQSVLVSVQDRKVVSYLGLKYKNQMYYTIDSLDSENGIDAIYNVGYENPNKGQPAFKVKSECTEPGVSKITVYDVQYNTGYNTKWKVYYKKDYDTNWQTSDDLSFVVTSDGVYTIKLTNQNGDIVGTTTTEIGAFAYKKQNSTLASSTDKNTMTSKNPVIPQGFKAVDTDTAKWKYTNSNYNEIQGWNDGLVIEDDIGNQFVWVPCTIGTSTDVVTYSKNFSYASNFSASDLNTANAFDTTTVDGKTYSAIPVRENEQIFNYGGFYVARYEAGLPTETLEQSAKLNNVYTSIPVSKYGSKVWNYIDYTHSYVNAEKMINNTAKYGKNKSGLITGTQWDTIMQWLENSGIGVTNSNKTINNISVPAQNWGTYKNITYTLSGLCFTRDSQVSNWDNVNSFTHHSDSTLAHYHASGLNLNNGYKKNIADLGGNVYEFIAEKYSSYFIARGAHANDTVGISASRRQNFLSTYSDPAIGFRPVLYIQDELQKEYVTDGLLAYYDAENNTGTGHSFSTTTWKDLSGNNNDATLSGFDGNDASGWHSNYLAFDGENDYVTGELNSSGDITVEFIAKKKNNNTSTMYMFNFWVNTRPSLQAWSTNTSLAHRVIVPQTNTSPYIEKSSYLGSASFANIGSSVIAKSSNNIKSYNNGQYLREITDTSFIERFNITDINFTIGKWHNSNSYFSNQNVYAMRIYNRALTEDEIRQNYEIDKVRFNIQE